MTIKELVRATKYIIIILYIRLGGKASFRKYPYEEIEERERKNKSKARNAIQLFLGSIYYRYRTIEERLRIKSYSVTQEIRKHSILLQLLKYTRYIVYYLLFAVIVSWLLDYLFWQFLPIIRHNIFLTRNFNIPSIDFMNVGLEVFVGAISAILGLIFALYTVGFQLSTDRYSEKVTDFINQESVSNYFFGLLVFTDLFSIITLVRLHFFNIEPVVSFLLSAILVIISILGILIFKNHYMNSLKPINLLESIWRLCREKLEIATNPKSKTYKSWSLVTYARNESNRYLNIIGDLYRDLKRDNNWNDAVIVPIIIGHILRDYTDEKRFINKEKGWWFFKRFEKVKANDLMMFTIKANYEMQAKGPLHIPKTAQDWYENKIFELLDEMTLDIPIDKSNRLASNIATAYSKILVGDYEEQVDAPPKLIPGAIQNQEFDLFDKGFKRFLGLWKNIDFSKETPSIEFINSYFAVSIGLLDEWDLTKVEEIAKSFYIDGQLNMSKEFLNDLDIPTYSREILNNYWERLEVEQVLEGKITTPLERFIEEVKDVLREKRTEIIEKYLSQLFKNSDEIIIYLLQQGKFEYSGQIIKIQCEWISRLFYLEDYNLAEGFAPQLRKSTDYVAILPKNVVLDLELLEQAEKGFFVALIQRQKGQFTNFAKMLVFIMLIIRDKEENQDELIKFLRLPLIWGGVTFLVSELDQDSFYVTTFISYLEKSYRQGWMAQVIDTVSKLRITRNIFFETTRYSSWYQNVFNSMESKLRKVAIVEVGAIGFQEGYDHPSKVIQKLGMFRLMEEEIVAEEFVEWIKKREEIKKIVYILTELERRKR